MSHAVAAPRGCGKSRTQGGIYMETAIGPNGAPLEEFLIDPPVVLDFDALGISPRGVTLIPDQNGVHHVFDWVGSEHYPNVTDFIEEVRRLGPSRRLPRTLEFEKLTRESRMVFIHARAYIENFRDLYRETEHTCPRGLGEHASPQDSRDLPAAMCAGLWWQDVEPVHLSRVEREAMAAAHMRSFTRTMPAFSYEAMAPPPGHVSIHGPAMFMALPITNLSVVRSQDAATEQAALDAVRRAGIGWSLDDE